MTDHFDNKPISTLDEICHLTIETMRKMGLETLLQLKKQATRELDCAKLTRRAALSWCSPSNMRIKIKP